ncbi:MAG: hypothetical protein KJO90_03550 [Eudoraea sp.]|nr:hypothetical protein [Eudoraea sp.]
MKFMVFILVLSILSCNKTVGKKNAADKTAEVKQLKCVEHIFTSDSILGEVRNHASEKVSLSQSIMTYTEELESLDFSNCPEKFTSAFRQHIEAWKMVMQVSDKYPSLRGELHSIFAELEKSKDSTEFKYLVKQVWDTWNLAEQYAQ